MVRRHLAQSLIALLLSLFSTVLLAATLEARVDRKALIATEHLTLTIALTNSDTRLRAQGVDPNIDLTMLTDDFELGIPQAHNRYSPFRNRGRSSSEIVVTLFPKGEGTFTIPSFTVDGESTAPITITVHQLGADSVPEVFSRSGVLKSTLWLREQTIAYLDLYHRVELKSAKLGGAIESEPKLQIQLTKLPQTDRTELYNGVSYNVTRSAWAVAPAIDQTIKLFLPDIWVETRTGKQQRFPFNDITIESRALPENVPAQTLVGRPLLSQSILPADAKQHHSVQLEITLQAPTNIINLSQTPPSLNFPEGLKVYAESTPRRLVEGATDGSTTISYRYFIMPLKAGSYQLSNIHIPYFDPEAGLLNGALLQGQRLEVAPAAIPASGASLPLPVTAGQTENNGALAPPALPWKIATLVLILLWLGTLFLLWSKKRKHKAAITNNTKADISATPARHPLQQQLLAAFGSRTLEQGLIQWERQHGVDTEMRAVIQQVQQRCYGENRAPETIASLQEEVNRIVALIKTESAVSPEKDRWRPEAFTAIEQN